MASLQRRLMVGTGIVITTGLVAASAVIYSVSSRALYREFDVSLLSRAEALAALTEFTEERTIEFDLVDADFPEYSQETNPAYFQLRHSAGHELARSRSLKTVHLGAPTFVNRHRFASVTLPDGRPGRQVTFAFMPKDEHDKEGEHEFDIAADPGDSRGGVSDDLETVVEIPGDPRNVPATYAANSPVAVTVAVSTTTIGASLARLGWLLAIVNGTAGAACLAMLAVVVRRGLQPLRDLSHEIDQIGAQTLNRQLDMTNIPSEVVPIVERLNQLLARLEKAFEQERAFSSDVAHELRTPLAGLRSTIEVCRARHRPPSEYREALDQCLAICGQSQDMVEDLLTMSRVENGRATLASSSVHLDDLLRDCWKPLALDARKKGLLDHWQLEESCELVTDRDKLQVIVRNVLENAVEHSDAGGVVRIRAARDDGLVAMTVENSGNRVQPQHVAHVFQRFWRGDAARADTGQHTGLGLPLAQRLAQVLGGEIKIDIEGDQFRASLKLPAERNSRLMNSAASCPESWAVSERASHEQELLTPPGQPSQ